MWESTENSHPDGRLNPRKRTENALIKWKSLSERVRNETRLYAVYMKHFKYKCTYPWKDEDGKRVSCNTNHKKAMTTSASDKAYFKTERNVIKIEVVKWLGKYKDPKCLRTK